MNKPMQSDLDEKEQERLRRWRLILGGGVNTRLNQHDQRVDAVLTALYGDRGKVVTTRGGRNGGRAGQRQGGLEESMPNISRWLGDVRDLFPETIVQVMQQDAIERVGLQNLLSDPEILQSIEPDVHLVATLMSLKDVIPEESKDSARWLVKKVVDDLLRRLEHPMQQAIRGILNRAQRNRRPRFNEIDWNRTVRANLKHYQPAYDSIIPESLIGFGRKKRKSMHDIIICIDQSGSMADSMVYASVFGAVMASIPALKTTLLTFDTSVVDLTAELDDPVDILFGVQLGGGTDINQALAYAQRQITRPAETTLVLITDLYEGGNYHAMVSRAGQIVGSGVRFITLLALSDTGTPGYNHQAASDFAGLGIPTFACTPDLFPELMAAAVNRGDIAAWASRNEIKLATPNTDETGRDLFNS